VREDSLRYPHVDTIQEVEGAGRFAEVSTCGHYSGGRGAREDPLWCPHVDTIQEKEECRSIRRGVHIEHIM
jgi:hypothetical protein